VKFLDRGIFFVLRTLGEALSSESPCPGAAMRQCGTGAFSGTFWKKLRKMDYNLPGFRWKRK
jgi:hypothetical protein